MKLKYSLLTLITFIVCWTVNAQETIDSTKTDTAKSKKNGKQYEDVITDEAKTDEGLFMVHLLDDKDLLRDSQR